jgi:hypothetical protein
MGKMEKRLQGKAAIVFEATKHPIGGIIDGM